MSTHLLLTLDYAGRAILLADGPCNPVSEDGPLHYRGGLPPLDVDEGVELLGDGGDSDIDIEAILPVDVAALTAQGHPLEGQVAEVALWEDGDAWEERSVVAAGQVADPRWGPAGTPTRITIPLQPEDQAVYPPERARVGPETWSSARDQSQDGKPYPRVIGYPGVYGRGADGLVNISGSPAYVVYHGGAGTHALVLVAGHPTEPGRVRFRLETTGDEDDHTATALWYIGSDALGQAATYVWVDGITCPTLWPALTGGGYELYVQWTGSATGTGPEAIGGRPLERAGDVLRWALEQSSIPVDWERTAAAAEACTWSLAGYWDQTCSPLRWVREQLLPILPYSLRVGPGGLYPVYWPWLSPRAAAVAHLETGRNASLVPEIGVSSQAQRARQVSVRFARAAATGEYQEAIVRTVDPIGYGTPRGRSRSLGTALAGQRNSRTDDSIDADLIWSPTTAGRVAAWRETALCLPRDIYQVDGDWRIGHLRAGDLIELTASEIGAVRRLCAVRNIRRSGPRIRVTLVSWRST